MLQEPRRRRGLDRAVMLLVCACFAFGAHRVGAAEEQVPPPVASPRPKIGIAFSGGGAKGCAHIGVLRVLEELHVPVDYAAGTSMGSIVGGLYATGMTPAELEQAILGVDWADALTDKPSRDQLIFRRKNDDVVYLPDIEMGIGRRGLSLPTGLRTGQKLNYLLRRFTLPVRSVSDFDDLPIPFRAVATDIGNGQMVVLDHGDLARAMRASMAIPGVFSAVEMDGKLLVDGGVTNNVPVDVVRAMGADVVIAIDIGSPLTAEEEVGRSYVKILGQLMGMVTRSNMASRLAAADLVITPAVAGYGTMDFASGKDIIALGEAEARKYADVLSRYSVPEEEYRRWQESHRRTPDTVPVVSAVRIEGNRRVDTRALAPYVEMKTGEPFSPEAARDDLARLYGLGDFEAADVYLVPEGDGDAVVYRVREKPWGPTYLRFGLGFQSNLQGGNDLALLAGVNRTRIDALGAEWKTDVQFGTDRYARSGFYQPLSFRSGWFVEPWASFRRRSQGVFSEGARTAELEVRNAQLHLDLGYLFGRYGEARLGLEGGRVKGRQDTGEVPPELKPFLDRPIDRGGLDLSGILDTLDNAKLPKHGNFARLTAFHSLSSLGAEDEYSKVELRVATYRTRGRSTVFGNLQWGGSPGGDLPVYDLFLLGGFFSFSGFEPGELAGDSYGLARAGYYYKLTKLFHAGGYAEAAQVSSHFENAIEGTLLSATALLVGDTAAGPLYLGAAAAEHGHRTLYVLFGRIF